MTGRVLITALRGCFPAIIGILIPTYSQADSPPNIITDIPWTDTGGVYDTGQGLFDATFNGVTDIEAAFNNARRQEEVQLGLTSGELGNLNLPANYASLSDDQKALIIINAERTTRAGKYGNTAILGLPLERTDPSLNAVAQAYTNVLLQQNTTGHNNSGSPSDRLYGAFGHYNDPSSCLEFMARSENLAYFWTSGNFIPLPLERSIYAWIYDDSGSAWGHREAVLLQDKDLDGNTWGYTNNSGSAASEGYLGIGVGGSTSYNNGFSWANYGVAVTMNIIDPDPACSKPRSSFQEGLGSISYNANSGQPRGTLTVDFEFTYISGPPLQDLFFVFHSMENAILVNADQTSNGSGLGSRLSVENSNLPGGDDKFDPGDVLTVQFQIGIQATPWKANFEVWALPPGMPKLVSGNRQISNRQIAQYQIDSTFFEAQGVNFAVNNDLVGESDNIVVGLGCSLNPKNKFDPALVLLLLMAVMGVTVRRKENTPKRGN